jgi:hypothetical protein
MNGDILNYNFNVFGVNKLYVWKIETIAKYSYTKSNGFSFLKRTNDYLNGLTKTSYCFYKYKGNFGALEINFSKKSKVS